MDYIKLAQRTIAMLNSMIESGECHTTRSREMVNNALNGLDQLTIPDIVEQRKQFKCRNVACNEMVSVDSNDVFCEKHKRRLGI